ncbi:MAG: hypothetical protein HOO96_35675 [Polyangiaceae bacterium]|nr:hypothetical protein [Polyangiaceae bacterium]
MNRPLLASVASVAFALVLPAFALGVRISPASEVAPAPNPDMEAARHLDFDSGRCAASPVSPTLARK